MKKILLSMIALMSCGLLATAQTSNEVDIETSDVELEIITPAEQVTESEADVKAREKHMRELNDDISYAKASNSMRRGYFVLVADNIQLGHNTYRHYDISSSSNFILVQGDDGIVQYALNMANPGANGLGGWTGKGTVRNKRITCTDKGDVYMQFDLVGSRVNASVDITLFHNSKRAVAHISDGRNIIMYGEVLPYRDKDHR